MFINSSLKRSFVLLASLCLLASTAMAAGICIACRQIAGGYPHGGIAIASDGTVTELAQPTAEQMRVLRLLSGIELVSIAVLPVGGLGMASVLFYRLKLKRPISILQMGMERIRAHDLDFTIPAVSGDELGQVLKGTVKLLRRGGAEEQALDRLDVYTRRIEQYVEAMSGIQRLEQLPVQCRPVSLARLGEELEETVRLLAPALERSCTVPEAGQAELDHGLFLTAAENLIANAARFARTRVEVSLQAGGGFLTLAVADDGPGFPPELLKTGPKPFGQQSGEAGHLGMGLYGSALLCRKHGGELRLKNCPGAAALASFHSPYSKQ